MTFFNLPLNCELYCTPPKPSCDIHTFSLCRLDLKVTNSYDTHCRNWGCSSVGRASEWHSEGQGFDSPYLHKEVLAGKRGLLLVSGVFELGFSKNSKKSE